MKRWAIAGGHIPLHIHSQDVISILNLGKLAEVRIYIYHPDRQPVGPYCIEVQAQRVRKFRVNDLIEPEALLLDEPYGMVIETTREMIVQFLRQDTMSICGSIAYSEE